MRKLLSFRELYGLLKLTFNNWSEDKVPQLGAALAFYSMLSLGPMVLIGISIAGIFFGHEAATGQIVGQIDGMIGHDGAQAVQGIIKGAAAQDNTGWLATVLGFATLLFGASGVFGQLQDSFNAIWRVPPKQDAGLWALVKSRFFSFSMVMGAAFLLLLTIVLTALLSAAGSYAQGGLPQIATVMAIINAIVGFGIIWGLFALIFKFLPETRVEWRDVRAGSLLTALLFVIGKAGISYYLAHSGLASGFGAAGSLVVMLVWVYYSAQILFFGAAFTYVYAEHEGSHQGDMKQRPPQSV